MTVTLLNIGLVPANDVIPEKVTVPVPAENDPPLIFQLEPFMMRLFEPAEKEPPEKSAFPFTVILLVASDTVPPLLTVKLFKAVEVVGSSIPVDPAYPCIR